jgi:hypothetical protein
MAKNNFALSKFIPREQLDVKKKEIAAVVRTTESNQLHNTFSKAKVFFDLFQDAVKNEFISRAKIARKTGVRLETDLGTIQFATRHNYKFELKKVLQFLRKKKIGLNEVFTVSYSVGAISEKKINKLVEKGVLVPDYSMDNEKYSKLAERFPELLDFVTDKPTEYIRGL